MKYLYFSVSRLFSGEEVFRVLNKPHVIAYFKRQYEVEDWNCTEITQAEYETKLRDLSDR
jgi:hypothetical protein